MYIYNTIYKFTDNTYNKCINIIKYGSKAAVFIITPYVWHPCLFLVIDEGADYIKPKSIIVGTSMIITITTLTSYYGIKYIYNWATKKDEINGLDYGLDGLDDFVLIKTN